LQLNCAGLLVGDTAACYTWRSSDTAAALAQQVRLLEALSPAADAAPAAASSSATTPAAELARYQLIGKQGQQAPAVGSPASPAAGSAPRTGVSCKQQRKAVQQPPGGNLDEWLGAADMQLQVGLDVCTK
jgi:hypothetical protein